MSQTLRRQPPSARNSGAVGNRVLGHTGRKFHLMDAVAQAIRPGRACGRARYGRKAMRCSQRNNRSEYFDKAPIMSGPMLFWPYAFTTENAARLLEPHLPLPSVTRAFYAALAFPALASPWAASALVRRPAATCVNSASAFFSSASVSPSRRSASVSPSLPAHVFSNP